MGCEREVETGVSCFDSSPGPLGCVRLAGFVARSEGIGRRTMRLLGSYAAVLVTQGGGQYWDLANGRMLVKAGDLITLLPTLPHGYGPGEGQRWDEAYTVFDGPCFDLLGDAGRLDSSRPVRSVRHLGDWAQRFSTFVQECASCSADQRCANLFSLLCEALETSASFATADPWLDEANSVLSEALHEPRTSADFAIKLGMSDEAFRSKYRKAGGGSPMAFRTERRLALAKELLRATSLTPDQIALSLGYWDSTLFERSFTRRYGTSPSAYRHAPSP